MKVSYTLPSVGLNGEEKLFKKPWFIVFGMFVSMCTALLVDVFQRLLSRAGSRSPSQMPLLDADNSPSVNQGGTSAPQADKMQNITTAVAEMQDKSLPFKAAWEDYCVHTDVEATPSRGEAEVNVRFLDYLARKANKALYLKKLLLVSLPACFDIVATGLCSMGFIYISASVWQLLRGAELIFIFLFGLVFLKQDSYGYRWFGMAWCVAGVTLVGFSSVLAGGQSASGSQDSSGVLFGMGLVFAGQIVQAAQVTAEEWLLKEMTLPGNVICGYEGVWGAVIMLVLFFPAFYLLPGSDEGCFENEIDAFVMLGNNSTLLGVFLLYMMSCAAYNMAGIAVTGALTGVHRVMLEALRTVIVWGFDLSMHYFVDANSSFGEVLTSWSVLEVLGFVLIMLGQAIHNGFIKVPGLYYPLEVKLAASPSQMASPGSMRNLGHVPTPMKAKASPMGFAISPVGKAVSDSKKMQMITATVTEMHGKSLPFKSAWEDYCVHIDIDTETKPFRVEPAMNVQFLDYVAQKARSRIA
jgi:hypothetical protein